MRTRKLGAMLLALMMAASMLPLATGLAENGVDIKWSGTITVAPYMFGPIVNDIITPELEKRLLEYGYDVKLENVFIDNAQYAELLNLRIASGDAPDIFKTDNDTFVQYCQQGAIAMWDEEFFRENAPDIAAAMDSGHPYGSNSDIVDVTWSMTRYNDKMAVIPLQSEQTGAILVPMYNQQWLNKLGADVPETLDEFIELARRFTFEDPDGNGKDDTYGLSSSYLNLIFGAFGSFPGFLEMDNDMWFDVDGKLISSHVMPGNKEALAVIHQLYEDGVLDPEFVTMENTGGYWALSTDKYRCMTGSLQVALSASVMVL